MDRGREPFGMGNNCFITVFIVLLSVFGVVSHAAASQPFQSAQSPSTAQSAGQSEPATGSARDWSGMYSFLKEGEFVQVTVEDDGRVTGFISRFGDGENDKGEFLDQFFKTAKLEGKKLTFATQVVHGVWFDFKGMVERGEGKNPGDEAYYVLNGSLTESSTDGNKNVTTRSRDVVFKIFPREASGERAPHN